MKNIVKLALLTAGVFSFACVSAQTHRDTTVGQKIDKTAHKVGHATAHAAASADAAITDKKYEGKCGPGGQTVYINKYSHYYYISKRGHRVYLKKSQLRDKPM
jgi:hypothetical protein